MSTCHSGQRISNYLLEEMLGAGSFAQVWRAKHHIFDEWVAIKVPTDPQYIRNLQREGAVIHGLRHPNIVRALDMDPLDDPPYLVMELVAGPTLRDMIDTHTTGLPINAVIEITRGILSGLSAAHKAGLIHRDLKPANILLAASKTDIESISPNQVKISDFGLGTVGGDTTISILQSGSLLTEEGKSISGTLAYMSPEQRDGLTIDARSDLYAVGMILFEMLTGKRPQGSDSPSALRADTTTELDDVFRRCYTRLETRYQRAVDILHELDDLFDTDNGYDAYDTDENHGTCDELVSDRDENSEHAPYEQRVAQIPPIEQICPKCDSAVRAGDQFCMNCGQMLADRAPNCPACGAYTYEGDRYCMICGRKLA